MNPNVELRRHRHSELTWIEKIAALAAWTLGGAIFLTVGWMAMVPDDPLAAVSLCNRTGWPSMWFQTTALVVVASALGTALAGRALVDAGVFVAALGLSLVTLRGGTAAEFFVGEGATLPARERTLAILFAGEALAWSVTVVMGVLMAAVVQRWFHGAPRSGVASLDGNPRRGSGMDLPWVGAWLGGGAARTPPGVGLRHAGLVAVSGWILVGLFSSGHTGRSITHGESCFAVAAATMLSVYFVQRSVPVGTAVWSWLGVVLMTMLGACWALVAAGWGSAAPNLPSSAFLRVLPLQSIAVGAACAVVLHWYVDEPPSVQAARPAEASRERRSGTAR